MPCKVAYMGGGGANWTFVEAVTKSEERWGWALRASNEPEELWWAC